MTRSNVWLDLSQLIKTENLQPDKHTRDLFPVPPLISLTNHTSKETAKC